MKTIEQAKKYFEDAMDIRRSSATYLNQNWSHLGKEIAAIESDNLLSAEGRQVKKTEFKEKATRAFLSDVSLRKQKYVSDLKKAFDIADKIVHNPLKRPDEETVRRFEKSLREIKTQVSLSVDAKYAKQKLVSFVEGIKDPYLADLLRDEFGELSGAILRMSGDDKAYRVELSQIYNDLDNNFKTDEAREAQAIMQAARENLENPRIFPPTEMYGTNSIEASFIANTFNREALVYYHNPEQYFVAKNENPPVYEDPEAKVEKKSSTPVDPEYVDFMKKAEELRKRIEAFGKEE
ncbi:hypothetical protein COJ96_06855 [Bacillus sp. AFS073361]|uniref:hypothetical protein n=1 Tax=Bacillus sp. AFS073361 TaxID=2033511 RepID=UPI000BF54F0D|nr:hypothetical protein [Bacillus sp. AFS073361]PFP30132.1 hypothetical protein COJ96_06855 [Bacillus sp. AFS073361]